MRCEPLDRLATRHGDGDRHPPLGQVPQLRRVDPEVLSGDVDVAAVEQG
jgi:hypothetical protein